MQYITEMTARQFHPLKDAHGRVFLNPEQTDGFCFRCPGDPDNLRPVSEYLERLLTEENWDGAFLDRGSGELCRGVGFLPRSG